MGVDNVIKFIICTVCLDKNATDELDDSTYDSRSKAESIIERVNQITKEKYNTEIDNAYLANFLEKPNIFNVYKINNVIQRCWLHEDAEKGIRYHYLQKIKERNFKRYLDILDNEEELLSSEYISDYCGQFNY